MGFYLIICTMCSVGGALYIAFMVWSKKNKERLLKKYKPGSIAYEATLKNVRTLRLAVTLIFTLIATVLMAVVIRLMLSKFGEDIKTLIATTIGISILLLSLPIYATYRVFEDPK